MREQIEFDAEKFNEATAAFGANLAQAFIPAIAAFESFAVQLAAELETVINAFIGLIEVNWANWELELTLENPERWECESLVDWGNRLERAGLFDSYEYRWMYQKEVWRSMLHSPVWTARLVWGWIISLRGTQDDN